MNKKEFDDFYENIVESHPWRKPILYVDVDETLISSPGHPKKAVVTMLMYAKAKGCTIYLWSQGGADYCEEQAKLLEIDYLFTAFLSKPDLRVDDLEGAFGEFLNPQNVGRDF